VHWHRTLFYQGSAISSRIEYQAPIKMDLSSFLKFFLFSYFSQFQYLLINLYWPLESNPGSHLVESIALGGVKRRPQQFLNDEKKGFLFREPIAPS